MIAFKPITWEILAEAETSSWCWNAVKTGDPRGLIDHLRRLEFARWYRARRGAA